MKIKKEKRKEIVEVTWKELKVFIDGKELLCDSMVLSYEYIHPILPMLKPSKPIATVEITTIKGDKNDITT